jgi:hypothetical protein
MTTATAHRLTAARRVTRLGVATLTGDQSERDPAGLTLTIHISIAPGSPVPPMLAGLLDSLDALVQQTDPRASAGYERPRLVTGGAGEPAVSVTAERGGAGPTAPLLIDMPARSVLRCGAPLRLARREYELLTFLCRHPGQVFSRAQLLGQVWGYRTPVGQRTVDVHIRRLRAKLDGQGPTIQTVRGFGYRLDGLDRATLVPEPT